MRNFHELLAKDHASRTNAPFVKDAQDTTLIGIEKIVALFPLLLLATLKFGERVLIFVLVSLITAVVTDLMIKLLLWLFASKRKPYFDISTLFSALLVMCTMPYDAPMWALVISIVFTVLLSDVCRGFFNNNVVVPSAAGAVFAALITSNYANSTVMSPMTKLFTGMQPDYSAWEIMIGRGGGNIGELAGLLILVGAIYLLITSNTTWEIPVCAVACSALIFYFNSPDTVVYYEYLGAQLVSGGLLFASIYVCADFAALPKSRVAKFIYGAIVGAVTAFVRLKFSVEGAYIGVLLASALVWPLDTIFSPARFGGNPNKSVSKKK